jgi:protoheme IX farnesyltransferase
MEAGTRTRSPAAASAALPRAARLRVVAADYLAMTKPKVQSLLLFTTVTTMYVAGDPSLGLVALTCLGGALSAGGAGAINHYWDRDLDAQMERTAGRPVPSGRVSPRAALRYGIALGCASFVLLALTVNLLAAALALSGLLGYVLVYTVWLKRSTPQNIVIGGAAGAVPPLVAWAAVTGSLDGSALYLFAIVFYWTPPHFWALSLLMRDEYAKAGVPMLPVVRGAAETRRQILLYAILLVAVSVLPFAGRLFDGLYFAAALGLGAAFVALTFLLWRRGESRSGRRWALRVYLYSLAYLALLFSAMVADVRL